MSTAAPTTSAYGDLLRRANTLRRTGAFAEAAHTYLQAAEATDSPQEALLFHAISLKDAGQETPAIQAYQQLLARCPDYAIGWSLFGTWLRKINRLPEAIDALRRSLALRNDIETRNVLVMALYSQGELEAARLEGLRNLYEKDQEAMQHFSCHSPRPSLQLPTKARAFDPQARTRNVIAFSLWGEQPAYVHGAIENARLATHLYYGWSTRIYHDDSVPADAIQTLQRAGAQTVRIADPALQAIKPMWRFMAANDPEVDWFLCRDADSRLNAQELLAVQAWLHSGQPFHIMRDHIFHMELILAGMWGGAAGVLPNIRQQLLHMPHYFNNAFADQAYLKNEIWPLIRDHSLTHDSEYHFYRGHDFPDAYRLPRPIHVGGSIKQMRHWREDTTDSLPRA